MTDVDRFLPHAGLPATPFPALATLEWLDMDAREKFPARGRNPAYGEHDITYDFNSLGYRCASFESRADIRIVAIGCSYVMGIGLPQAALFHEQFAVRLRETTGRSALVWNLSIPGASNDYITRLLFLAVPHLDPHIVIVNFTHAGRREYLSVQNRLASYTPGFRPSDPVSRDICSHFDALSSPYDDGLNLFRNYKAVASLLAHRCWLFSTIDPQALNRLEGHLDLARHAGHMPVLDRARDGAHPGPLSHTALMESYWRRFTAVCGDIGT